MSHDNNSGTSVPAGAPHYAQPPGAPPYAGGPLSAPSSPSHMPTQVSMPASNETKYVRKVNKPIYRAVIAGIIALILIYVCAYGLLEYAGFCALIAGMEKVKEFNEKNSEMQLHLLPSCAVYISATKTRNITEDDKKAALPVANKILTLPIVKLFVILSYVKFPLLVYCACGVVALLALLTADLTRNYKHAQAIYAIVTVALHIWHMLAIGYSRYTFIALIVFGAIICPYPFIALGALRDLTGERARRWLPVYYEAAALDPKTAV